MWVQKTVPHHGWTQAHGAFNATETVFVCANGCRHPNGTRVTQRSSALVDALIPQRSVGYDTMCFVGMQRFLHHQQREEIRSALLQHRDIRLSTGELSNLAQLFLTYLRRLHRSRTQQLRLALQEDGGWPLHVDATTEGGRGTLFIALAGWRRWILDARKLKSENADDILAVLRSVVAQFGPPCAIMRDLGRGMIPACSTLVAELAPGAPILSCHEHFLADIGTDLMEDAYATLRSLFRRANIRATLRRLTYQLRDDIGDLLPAARDSVLSWQHQPDNHLLPDGVSGLAVLRALILWVLDFDVIASFRNFPFVRPYLEFFDRCMKVRRVAETFLRSPPADKKVLRRLAKIHTLLEPVLSEVSFGQVTARLRARAQLFDQLRDVLRIEHTPTGDGSIPSHRLGVSEQEIAELNSIKEALELFTAGLQQRRAASGTSKVLREGIGIILKHIERHGDTLWGHEIQLPESVGGGTRLVDRTHYEAESFFHRLKHEERRRSGRRHLPQDFDHLPPEAALARNLNCPDYVRIVCGSLDQLPLAFAELDKAQRRDKLALPASQPQPNCPKTSESSTKPLNVKDRRVIRTAEMANSIEKVANAPAPEDTRDAGAALPSLQTKSTAYSPLTSGDTDLNPLQSKGYIQKEACGG